MIKTKNGLEFVTRKFNEFCRVEGIRSHKMISITQQQNELTKRMNKIILKCLICMLLGLVCISSFWEKLHTMSSTWLTRVYHL